MKYLFLIFCLVCGCTFNVPNKLYREKLDTYIVADLLIEEYEVRFHNLTDRCKNHLHNVIYVNSEERIYDDSDFCLGLGVNLNGEHYYDGTSYVWIKKRTYTNKIQ